MQKIVTYLTATALLIFPSLALAAKDGDLSLEEGSSGEKTITINVKQKIKISGLEDAEFGEWKVGDGDQINENQLCIYSNSASGYKVIAKSSSSGVEGEFAMASDTETKIKYLLKWYDTSENSLNPEGVDLVEGNATSQFFNAERHSSDCSGGNNSKLKLVISSNELEQAQGSDVEYSDTLTITVAPR